MKRRTMQIPDWLVLAALLAGAAITVGAKPEPKTQQTLPYEPPPTATLTPREMTVMEIGRLDVRIEDARAMLDALNGQRDGLIAAVAADDAATTTTMETGQGQD